MLRERNWLAGLSILPRLLAITLGSALILPQHHAEGGAAGDPTRSPQRIFDRVFVIVLENSQYDEALQQPFLRQLTTTGALFTDFHAIAHPSYPNYLAMAAGSTFGIGDNEPRDLDETSLVDLFESAGVSWKVYAENLPGHCFTGIESRDGLYVRKHEPFISFRNIQASPTRCDRIVDASQFQADLAKDALPEYSLYVPNLRNDGHGTPRMDLRAWGRILLGRNAALADADAWLKRRLAPLLEDPQFIRGTLVVVTFDESGGGRGNHIYTVLIGPMVQAGATNGKRYDHFSLLRTIEDNFGIGTLGREDATASPICCVWSN